MKRMAVVWCAGLVLVVGHCWAQTLAAEAVDLSKVKIPEKQKSYELCPVHLVAADPKIPTWTYKGVTYGADKPGCQAAFMKDPDSYAEKAKRKRWENNFIQAMSTIWCPVTDEIGPGGLTEWHKLGLTWESCCQFCNQTVRDDMFPRALERLKKRAAKSYALTGGAYVEGAASPVMGAIDFDMVSDANSAPAASGGEAAPVEEPAWLAGKDLKPTYTGGVALIFEHRCISCHRPGSVAPMSFLTYPGIRKYMNKLKPAITQREMPPWPADPNVGHFRNSKRLTQKEYDLLVAWADAYCPKGDGQYTPGQPVTTEWLMGEPDQVYELDEYEIPADVTEQIKDFTIKTEFPEDKWIVAAEARPSDPLLVRSIVAGPLGEYHRANYLETFPEGTGRLLKKGESITALIHYTKEAGWEEYDASKFAVKFAPAGAKLKNVLVDRMANEDFAIPAGKANVEAVAQFTFPQDGHIVSLTPVMRDRGKDARYIAVTPDGQSQDLLSIPKWNPKWQYRYDLAEPFAAPKGTVVKLIAHYDNSDANVQNPDPSIDVKAGPKGEILEGRIAYTLD